jgi:hypothetical protein
MATVATVFARAPWVRTPEEVVESLFRNAPPRPENKRVWASLVKGKAAVIAEIALEMHRRDPTRSQTHLALSDGERGLQMLVDKTLDVTLILDLIHALDKLWKAAYVFHAEGSLEAELWVRQRTLRILRGQVSGVVQGLRQSATKLKLPVSQTTTLSGVALRPLSGTRLANCQWSGGRGLQESDQRPHGAIRHAGPKPWPKLSSSSEPST